MFCVVSQAPKGFAPYYKIFLKARGYEVTEESMRELLEKEGAKEDKTFLHIGLDAIRQERMKGLAKDVRELGTLTDPYESRRISCLLTIDEEMPIYDVFEHLNRERKIFFEVKDVSPRYKKDSVEVFYAVHLHQDVDVKNDLLRVASKREEKILQFHQSDAFRKTLEWYEGSVTDTDLQRVLDSWKEQPTIYNYFLNMAKTKGHLARVEPQYIEPPKMPTPADSMRNDDGW